MPRRRRSTGDRVEGIRVGNKSVNLDLALPTNRDKPNDVPYVLNFMADVIGRVRLGRRTSRYLGHALGTTAVDIAADNCEAAVHAAQEMIRTGHWKGAARFALEAGFWYAQLTETARQHHVPCRKINPEVERAYQIIQAAKTVTAGVAQAVEELCLEKRTVWRWWKAYKSQALP